MLTPAFYALKDSRTPMLISLGSIVINIIAAMVLLRAVKMGHAGLALSTSCVALFTFFVQFWIMRRRIGGVYGRRLRDTILKVSLASAAMAATVGASSWSIHWLLGQSTTSRLLDLGVSITLGLAVLYIVCRWLKVDELDMAVRAIGGPIGRRLSGLNAKIAI